VFCLYNNLVKLVALYFHISYPLPPVFYFKEFIMAFKSRLNKEYLAKDILLAFVSSSGVSDRLFIPTVNSKEDGFPLSKRLVELSIDLADSLISSLFVPVPEKPEGEDTSFIELSPIVLDGDLAG